MTSVSNVDLTDILTPELLDSVSRLHFPWPEHGPLDFKAVSDYWFQRSPDWADKYYQLSFDAVTRPLSTIGVDNVPDLMTVLPPPEAPEFPQRALGLLLVLDQVPRMILSGINARYTSSYFDVWAKSLARRLLTLPPTQRPDNMKRWLDQGWSFEQAIIRRMWFYTPLMRADTEDHVGQIDPYRKVLAQNPHDIVAFSRLVIQGPPVSAQSSMEGFMFWLTHLLDVHTPIIRKYACYPYRNEQMGRTFKAEEKEFMRLTNNLGASGLSDGEIKHIRQDVETGRWTALTAEHQG
ncbi:hypothetical protein BZG36_04952 [Bifiguratus adelaidae]|uniref:Uncharacterized protein n=1 Tax=Bifiguratus adelaidae TaxID=1938954 RepID=A0A261XUX0_9FUNG|nr:hypothetical protein BZG36_04952 [Bifiguratus adelaidae]